MILLLIGEGREGEGRRGKEREGQGKEGKGREGKERVRYESALLYTKVFIMLKDIFSFIVSR